MRSQLKTWIVAGALLGLFGGSRAEASLVLDLTVDFDGGTVDYGTVELIESGGDVIVVITGDTGALGADVDVHEFYFNLPFTPTNLQALDSSTVAGTSTCSDASCSISSPATVAGAAGTDFEHEVNFGDGAPMLNPFELLLSADEAITIADLTSELSDGNNHDGVFVGVHFQNTTTNPGSEAVGAVTPEPGTALLLGLGLSGLAVRGRPRAI